MTTTPPDGSALAAELAAMWGTTVARSEDGRLRYKPRPMVVTDLLRGVERWNERTFLVHDQRRVSFAQFLAAIRVGASALADAGVDPGDRVMLLSYNRAEFVLAIWSIWWRGAVPVLANRWWTAGEIEHALSLTKPSVILRDRGGPAVTTRARIHPIDQLGAILDGGGEEGLEPATLGGEDVEALIVFTSGSSGPPKGVSLSQGAVIANQHNLLHRTQQFPHLLTPDRPQGVMLTSTPMFHIGGFSNLLWQMLVGGRLVLSHGRFDAGQVLELIERERVQRWGGVPTMAARVLAHPDFMTRDLSSLRSFPLGGAPVSEGLLQRLRSQLPHVGVRGLANTWGMTESGGFVTAASGSELEKRPGTVGRPYGAAEVRVVEPDAGGTGEIQVRSPTVMTGYLGPSDDELVDSDGWLSTGDLGHLDEDGYLFIDGRKKDVIIRGGENVAAIHVERAILSHPDVVETAVVGLPHDDLGEEVAVVVRIRPAANVGITTLREHLGGRLSHFEVPSTWQLTEDPLPTLAGEKIDKAAIVRQFGDRA